MTMRVLITGATGSAGKVVAQHLYQAGISIRIAVRSVEQARASWKNTEAEIQAFDFSKPDTFQAALKGISHLWLIAPPGSQDIKPVKILLEETPHQLEQVIMLSGRTTGDVEGLLLQRVEQYLSQQDLPYTILRAGWFMQNFTSWMKIDIEAGFLGLPTADAQTAFVDLRDLALAAEQTILDRKHRGKHYEIVGPEALNHAEVASILSEELGWKVEYGAISEESYLQQQEKAGWSPASAKWTAYLYELVRTGKEAKLSSDFSNMMEQSARTFRTFVRDHKKSWGQPQ